MSAKKVPHEIWRVIASFLPTIILFKLCTVNLAFLEVANETRYRTINVVADDTTKRLIKHVKESKLVHSVRVQPWIVVAKQPKQSFFTWKFLTSCVLPARGVDADVEAQARRRMLKQTHRVVDMIKTLPSVNKYHIDWDEGPYHKEFFTKLLDLVVPAIGKTLSALILKVPLYCMDILPRLDVHLSGLEQLSLTLHTGSFIPLFIAQGISGGLAVFINNLLRENLRSLSIYTTPDSTSLDLCGLFGHLGYGRRLTSFTLCIPFDGGHISDTTTLRTFLFKHTSTLESLNLGTTRATVHSAPGPPTAMYWIRDTLKDHPPCPMLSQLALGLRPLRTDLGPLVSCLNGYRPQLRVLRLSERPLEYAELERVLGALADAPLLRVLALRIRWLSPEVIDLLATSLPGLSALELNFTEVVHREPASDASSALSEDSYALSRECGLTLFCQALEARKYSHWKLTRLAVPENPRGKWLDAMEQAFVGCIPALTCFGELVV